MSINTSSFAPQAQSHELLALFGGTFDPIHYGHLRPVEQLAREIHLDKVVLIPNNVPPHRPQPEASAEQRLAMLQLAIEGNPLFAIDQRELRRDTPSYTIETLETLRKEYGNVTPLAFIIGQDSLLSLHKWHRWEALLNFCHLVVMRRPGYAQELETPALQCWLDAHKVDDAGLLRQQPHGVSQGVPGISNVTIRLPLPTAANISSPSFSRIRLISAFFPRFPAGTSISSKGISLGKRRK